MTEQELKELEELAKAAIEQHPEESEDMLERALLDRKQEIWAAIRKKARRRVLMRRARPWIASAAMLMAAILVIGVIGISQARAGKEGLLVDIVENMTGDIRIGFSEEPGEPSQADEFSPIFLENVSWDEIVKIADPNMKRLMPSNTPRAYRFYFGTYHQIDNNIINMWLHYINDYDFIITIHYVFNSIANNTFSDSFAIEDGNVDIQNWDGISVYLVQSDGLANIVWVQDHCMISISGEINESQAREIFNSIKREP